MANFNFKSSGLKISDREVTSKNLNKKTANVGIKTPLTNTREDQIFDMHIDPVQQIKDNLKNLLLTNAGERLGLYDFGADLNSVLFELSANQNAESTAFDMIKRAVDKYMSGVEITDISQISLDKNEKQDINKSGMAKVRIRVSYDIPKARITNQAIEVTLQTGG